MKYQLFSLVLMTIVTNMTTWSSCFTLGLTVSTALPTRVTAATAATTNNRYNGGVTGFTNTAFVMPSHERVGRRLWHHKNDKVCNNEENVRVTKRGKEEEEEEIWKKCRATFSAFAAASILFLSDPTQSIQTTFGADIAASPLYFERTASSSVSSPKRLASLRHALFRPSPVNAIETTDTATDLASSSSSSQPHLLEDDSDLPTPSAIGTMSSPDDNSQLSSPSSIQTEFKTNTVLDEVWTLVDKYYIDRTFHDQDWNQVKQIYTSKVLASSSSSSSSSSPSISDDKLMKIVTEMVQSLGDKYSRILDGPSYTRIQKFDLIGVGATLMPNGVDKRIMVGAPPVAGSAADKAGMKYGDYITAVNGIPTEGRTAFDIIDQISNDDPNAKVVTMTVLTEGPNDLRGEGYIRDLTLERQFEQVMNPVSYKVTEERKDPTSGQITKVGYIRITEFNSLVERSLRDAFLDLESQNCNAYVLDVRGNPGGAFQSAVEISSLFFENRVATYVVDSNGVELPFKTAKGKVVVDKNDPVVVWIDGRSASATEVLAGSLRDNCRAVVMGDTSFGKGLIQAVYGLKNGSGLVLTVARYVTPNGDNIQGKGILPDVQGSGIVPPSFVPGLRTDTSKVDFGSIRYKLSDKMCTVPEPMITGDV